MESINATFSTWSESYGSGPGARHPYTMPALQCIDLRVARYVGQGPLSKVAFICSLFLCAPSALDALKCKRGVGEPRCSCSNDAHLHMETSSTHSAGVAFIYSMGGLRGCDGKVCVLHVAGNSLQECRTFKGCRPPFSALHPMARTQRSLAQGAVLPICWRHVSAVCDLNMPGGGRPWGTIWESRSTPLRTHQTSQNVGRRNRLLNEVS